MAKPKPRGGTVIQKNSTSFSQKEVVRTLGQQEDVIWSTLNHLASAEVARDVASTIHKISPRNSLLAARSIGAHIEQASEFYNQAKSSSLTTAPLYYYYSFLNLSKVVIELHRPGLLSRTSNYNHGLAVHHSSTPAAFANEKIVITKKQGIFHELLAAVNGFTPPAANIDLVLSELFQTVLDLGTEVSSVFNIKLALIRVFVDFYWDATTRKAWLTLDVPVDSANDATLTVSDLRTLWSIPESPLTYLGITGRSFPLSSGLATSIQVHSFRERNVVSCRDESIAKEKLLSHLRRNCPIIGFQGGDSYSLLQAKHLSGINGFIPEVASLYVLFFWYGSLVRYDPVRLNKYLESKHRILLDGLLSQCRLKLLLLLEWEIYNREQLIGSSWA